MCLLLLQSSSVDSCALFLGMNVWGRNMKQSASEKECVFSVIPLEKYRYRKTFPQIQSVSPWLQAVIVSWWLAQFLLSSYWTSHKWHSGKVHVLLVLLERMNLPHKAFIAEPCYLSCSDLLSSMVANQVLFGTVVAHWQLYACLLYECQPVRTDTDCL